MKDLKTVLFGAITIGVGIIAYYSMTETRECETLGHASQRLTEYQSSGNIHTHRYIK